jgi:hypothetical protein
VGRESRGDAPEGSKSRYHFLFGDFSDLHRRALFEIQDAADNLFCGDIEVAAAAPISLLEAQAPTPFAPVAS